jgi:hypothetical protein
MGTGKRYGHNVGIKPISLEGVPKKRISINRLDLQEILVQTVSENGKRSNQFVTSLTSFVDLIRVVLNIDSFIASTIEEVSTTYQAKSGDEVWADASGGDFSVNFPSAFLNREVLVINIGDTGIVTAVGDAPIDGVNTTFELSPGESVSWKCDGSKWIGR